MDKSYALCNAFPITFQLAVESAITYTTRHPPSSLSKHRFEIPATLEDVALHSGSPGTLISPARSKTLGDGAWGSTTKEGRKIKLSRRGSSKTGPHPDFSGPRSCFDDDLSSRSEADEPFSHRYSFTHKTSVLNTVTYSRHSIQGWSRGGMDIVVFMGILPSCDQLSAIHCV